MQRISTPYDRREREQGVGIAAAPTCGFYTVITQDLSSNEVENLQHWAMCQKIRLVTLACPRFRYIYKPSCDLKQSLKRSHSILNVVWKSRRRYSGESISRCLRHNASGTSHCSLWITTQLVVRGRNLNLLGHIASAGVILSENALLPLPLHWLILILLLLTPRTNKPLFIDGYALPTFHALPAKNIKIIIMLSSQLWMILKPWHKENSSINMPCRQLILPILLAVSGDANVHRA